MSINQAELMALTNQDIIDIYKKLESDCLSKPVTSAKIYLESLTDVELYCYIAYQTKAYGRLWIDSKDNALCHLTDETSKAKYIKVCSMTDPERTF